MKFKQGRRGYKTKNKETITYKTISDTRLHTWLRRKLHEINDFVPEQGLRVGYILRTLANCGKNVHPFTGVHVASNGEQTKIYGQRFCDNAWICPRCTAKILSKYEAKITIAVQQLEKQGLVPIMVTFAVRHLSYIKCADIFEILYETYNKFTRKRTVDRKSENGDQGRKHGAFKNFCEDVEVQHVIRSSDVTFGINGWHPHFHVLLFIPKENLHKVLDWEETLNANWDTFVAKIAKKYITPDKYKQGAIDRYFEVLKRETNLKTNKHANPGVYFSRDNSGGVRVFKNGKYLTETSELTNKIKVANDGHYTQMQLLYEAYKNNDQKAWQKYLELAIHLVSRHRQRVRFSHKLGKMITEWMQHEEIVQEYKKKWHSGEKELKPLHTVCWFSSEQWLEIFYNDLLHGSELEYLIKIFAKYDDGYDLICQLMEAWNLSPPLKKHPTLDYTYDIKLYAA